MIKKDNLLYKIMRFLFPLPPESDRFSAFLLAFRILFGVLLMTHGVQKISNFSELQSSFPDPLHVGHTLSLSLAIFGELACSIGFILGAFYRLALIPMMFTMIVASFIIHAGDKFADKELSIAYLCVFIIMYIAGPGKFALDYFISEQISRSNDI